MDCNEDAAEQPSDDDLEDGELEDDDEQEEEEVALPVPENSAEIKENPPVVPVAIPSLLDLKISPPRNGILGNSSGRKSSRWSRKTVNRKRYTVREYGDSEEDDAEDTIVTKRSRKRKHDDRKTYGRFTDHDQNEDENGVEYSDISWFNSARGSRKKFGRLIQAPDDGSDSPLGPYDSPYASPPGPYDSPSASEDESSTVKGSESNSRRDQVVLDADRSQPTEKETVSDVCEHTTDIADKIDKQPIKNETVPLVDSDDNQVQSQVAIGSQSPRRPVPIDGRRQEREHRVKSSVNNPHIGMHKGSRSPEPQPQKKRRLVDTPWDERPVCKFYYEGKCQKGGECQFKHSRHCLIKKPILCRFYNKSGHCSRGPECTYHHETWPCVLFHKKTGNGCPYGDDCKFSHAELTDETKELLEKAEEEPQQTIEESEPKKKSLLGDFPLPLTSDKRIPSLFDIDIHRPSMMPAGNRPIGPRNFAMKAATMNRFSHMGPRPRPPPRHIAMQLIRMQMAAFMRPRHGSIRGQFPFMPMYADPQKMGFDPSLLNAFSQSEDYEEDEGVDWNEEEYEENSENDAAVSVDANIATPVCESLAVSSSEAQAIVSSSASETCVATMKTTACSAPVSNAPLLPMPFGPTSVPAVTTSVSSQQSAPASSIVVAGVDLTQLPPVQRNLFLRIHQQQQQNNAISEPVSPVTTSAITESLVNVENKQQTVAPIAVTTQSSSSTANISVSDILKVLVQQPPPANTSRLPLAPMFNINQVLSAINQVPGSAPVPIVASTEPSLASQEPTDSELEMNGVRTSIEYYLRPYDCAAGTVVPAYMDLNDSAWDEDPRVQHWRRDVELGRMPRREERRKPAIVSKPGDAPPVKRDPRLRNDVNPVPSQLPMQQQQLHIQQMVQQMINNNQQQQQQQPPSMGGFAPPMMHQMTVPPMMPGNIARVHMPPSVASVLPVVADVRVRPPGFPPVMPPGMPVSSLLGMVPPSSAASTIFPPLLTFNPSVPPPFMASPNSIPSGALPLNSLTVPPPSTTLMSTAVTCAQVVSVAPIAEAQLRPTALNTVASNLMDASTNSPTYSDDLSEAKSVQAPKSTVDYRNDPRFRKRKNQSNDGVVKSTLASGNSSPSARTGELSSDTVVASVADSGIDKDVLQFQSPLAVTSVNRSASSGYNRPPNKRYSELVEQNGQYQRRLPKSVVDVTVKKPGFNVQRQANVSDVSTVSSVTHSGNHYLPLMSSTDSLICDTQVEGSVKDMFKTIDPTASPFC